MSDPKPPTPLDLAEERTGLAHQRTDYAVERTVLAHERTLIAWVRTAASLITFGFTMYKGFNYLATSGVHTPAGWLSPRAFGSSLITIGLVALVLAQIQHARSREDLKKEGHHMPASLALVTAALVAGLGILGLGFAIFNL